MPLGGLALGIALLLVALPVLLSGGPSPEGAIPTYDVVLTVRPDGTVHVREAFTFDYAGTETDGLLRRIRQREGDRVYRLRNLTVTSTTHAPVGVKAEDLLHERRILIGEGRPVSGRHAYVLDYDLLDVLTPGRERDELLWDVLDPGWHVPVEETVIRIEGPATFASGCLAGHSDAVTPCARRQVSPTAVEYQQSGLRPHESMKIRAAFPKGVLHPSPPRYAPPHLGFTPWGWLGLLTAVLLAPVARRRTPPWGRRLLLAAGAGLALWDLLAETVPGGPDRLAVGDPLLAGLGLLFLGAFATRPPRPDR